MTEFILVFKNDPQTSPWQPGADEQLMYRKHWQDWFLSLAACQHLARPVQRWDAHGFVVTADEVLENRDTIEGLIFIRANDYDEAIGIAKDCPILERGGVVEVLRGN
nr:YciI family protein [uncultured Dyadobacter sp.]